MLDLWVNSLFFWFVQSNEEETGWGDIVFIPPGMDALSHLGKSQATVVG
jgi:hypothetical protein